MAAIVCVLALGGSTHVLVEGIFADRMVAPCRERGLLADAVCVHNPRLVTFVRRLVRDLREHLRSADVATGSSTRRSAACSA